jgi:hypothetical protein
LNTYKRLFAGFVLLVSAAMLVACIVGGVGVWVVKGPATERAIHVFERIDHALDLAKRSLDQVKLSLARASDRLDGAKEEQKKLAQQAQSTNVLGTMLARTIAPDVEDAHEKLHTVAEAAVVVNSMLEDVGNFPFLSVSGLDVDGLSRMNDLLAGAGPAAWELSRLLGQRDSAAAGVQSSQVERTLKTMCDLIAEYEPQLMEVHRRSDELKSRALYWITPASILFSVACFWFTLSQISLIVHAYSWMRKSASHDAGVDSSPRP